jgi:XTP/dITP diphosphohydrolase
MKILFATTNRGKVEEMRALLEESHFELVTLEDVGQRIHVAEDGVTFAANARKKATYVIERTGMITLADDSGLEVDALHGAPGVRSARYAGEPTDDAANNAKLLRDLAAIDATRSEPAPRTARFRCVLALAFPGQAPHYHLHYEEGTCEGEILHAPRGTGGFGYDPLFFIPQLGMSMAELPLDEKNRISHRAQALRKMAERMMGAVTGGGWWSVLNRGRIA